MLQYLVILLDDTSVAYCHTDNPIVEERIMPLSTLRKAIFWGMCENLMIHFVYPNYSLPKEYQDVIDTVDNVKIGKDIEVYNEIPKKINSSSIVLRLSINEFISSIAELEVVLQQAKRINICYTDIEHFDDNRIDDYSKALSSLNNIIIRLYEQNIQPQINILSDRIIHNEKMHNCDAGISNVTVAPNGKFYLCPSFYYDEIMHIDNELNYQNPSFDRSVGSLESGLDMPNRHLLMLNSAPLCRECDAYHCNRCIWLNQKLTLDCNTPGHQQCVLSHIERNASRDLVTKLKSLGYNIDCCIDDLPYLDPFEQFIKF